MDGVSNNTTSTFAGIAPVTFVAPWFYCFMVICLGSSVLVILLLVTLTVEKKWRSPSTFLVIHLLILDVLACGLSFPLLALDKYLLAYNLPLRLPCGVYFVTMSHWLVDCWAGTFLALNRFVAVLLPNHYKTITTLFAIFCTILASWITGFACFSPVLFGIGASFDVFGSDQCGLVFHYDTAWYTILGLGIFLPHILQGVAYAAIFVSLCRSTPKVTAVNGTAQTPRPHRNMKVVKMLAISYVASLICYTVSPLMMGFVRGLSGGGEVTLIGLILEISGYASAPVIYLLFNDEYRRATKSVLRRCLGRNVVGPCRRDDQRMQKDDTNPETV